MAKFFVAVCPKCRFSEPVEIPAGTPRITWVCPKCKMTVHHDDPIPLNDSDARLLQHERVREAQFEQESR